MRKTKDHLAEKAEAIDLVRNLRDLMRPVAAGGLGLTFKAVAKSLGMAEDGTGVRAWTGVWNGDEWVSGRAVPSGDRKKRLRAFVARKMADMAKEVSR